ncbi:MAG: lysophospholipid acyltransferase family protein [Patescibacteria group bacterium]|nr:lysophospholipid acyltransferase family protein [Patescibacteria group bacterium]
MDKYDRWYWLFQRLIRIILLPWRIKVEGDLPKEGAFVVIANHRSHADPVLIGVNLNRRMWFLAKKEIFSWPIIGWLVKNLDWALPVRKGATLSSLKKSLELLKQGKPVALFPEGGLREHLEDFQGGFIFLAKAGKVPIIPIAVLGAGAFLPKGKIFPRLTRIIIRVGEPIPYDERQSKEELKKLAMQKMAELLRDTSSQN